MIKTVADCKEIAECCNRVVSTDLVASTVTVKVVAHVRGFASISFAGIGFITAINRYFRQLRVVGSRDRTRQDLGKVVVVFVGLVVGIGLGG